MKRIACLIKAALPQLDRRHLQLIILVITLSLFVLGAGAPGVGSGPGGM
jgi:hypothetical protein